MGGVELPTHWLIVSMHIPIEVDRVNAERELRRIGAVPIGDDVWVTPDTPVFLAGVDRVGVLVDAAGGRLTRIDDESQDHDERMTMMTAFNAARTAEWAELRADCKQFDGNSERLDHLRRRAHEIQARDIFSVPEAEVADRDLRACAAALTG